MVRRWKLHVVRHPVLGAVELTLAWHAVLLLVAEVILPPLAPRWFPDLGSALVNVACAVAVLGLLWRWGWLRSSGVATLGAPRRWWLAVPLLLVECSYAAAGVSGGPGTLVGGVVLLFWGSVNEEFQSRGLVQRAAAPLGPARTSVLVGVLFGVGHFQNYLFFGSPLDNTLWQVLSTSLFGFGCATLRYATGSVWPGVVVHWSGNFFSIHSPGAAPDWWQACVYVFPVGYGVWLLRSHITHIGADDGVHRAAT
ncbi:CPBP family intramembrane glutamic endopeptidase [Streptomyces paludis]|uniref:CPBP family intramembrane metalloprotease n=1 Tax=Streptomyces paludis TaxID=2282738 RepID=A0A345HTC9_9ACTN|nr:CPBP family intramembrane glutamic endopeptidase [Streptomyces paludis]AXG79953.1 CPBP family intramembrane metalloprotease [Streptomyces paludis]